MNQRVGTAAKWAGAWSTALILSACGGGSGDGSADAAAGDAAPSATTAGAAAGAGAAPSTAANTTSGGTRTDAIASQPDPVIATATGGSTASVAPDAASVPAASLTATQRAALEGVNRLRTTARACDPARPAEISPAVPALVWNTRLEASAFVHSKDMQANDRIDHVGSDGSNVGQRISAQGYGWQLAGEALGGGYDSLARLLQFWEQSPSHCRVLMTARFAEMGLAMVAGTSGNRYTNFWTLDMAQPR